MNAQALGTIREFKTRDFHVVVDAFEDYDCDLSFDDTGEVRQKLETGEYVCFTVRARVIHKQLGEIGADYLGGCIYGSLEEFQDHRRCAAETRKLRASGSNAVCGSYFADMVSECIREARKTLRTAKQIRVR